MSRSVYTLLVVMSLSSHTFTVVDVEFLTKPPQVVRTFPGQNVTLPCILKNLIEGHHIVQWTLIEGSEIYNISYNRVIEYGAEFNFSIPGGNNKMNFTLVFKIPESVLDFDAATTNITTTLTCSVIGPNENIVNISADSQVIIQRWTIQSPACGKIGNFYAVGDILALKCCYNDSDPTISVIKTLKSGSGQVLRTYLDNESHIQNLTVAKEDHNAVFVCESRRYGTNEMRSCSIGPITVNYKPEINITEKSPMEFHCAAEARPPVNVTHWIVDSSVPQDSFTISNDVLIISKLLNISKIKIICKAENSIGKNAQTLIIAVDNQDDEIIPRQDEEDGYIIRVVIIVVSVLFCIILVVVSFYLYKSKQCKILKTANDNTTVDQSIHTDENEYQVPIKTAREHYQSLKVAESVNAKEDDIIVGYINVSPNEKDQSVVVTSSSPTYVNTLDNKSPFQLQKCECDENHHDVKDDNENDTEYQAISDVTSNVKGDEVTYVNNPCVKKCEFIDNVNSTNMENEEYDDNETDTDYETVPNLVTSDSMNDKSSHHSETTADVHYINLEIKAP